MKKSNINPMPEYFDRYINAVEDIELSRAFVQSGQQPQQSDAKLLTKLDGGRYARGKRTGRLKNGNS